MSDSKDSRTSPISQQKISETLRRPISRSTLKIVSNLDIKEISPESIIQLAHEATLLGKQLATQLKDEEVTTSDIMDSMLFVITHFLPLGAEVNHLIAIIQGVVPIFWKLACDTEAAVERKCKSAHICCFTRG